MDQKNEEILLEGLRVITNLSNTPEGKEELEEGTWRRQLLWILLESGQRDIVYYASCCLLNLGASDQCTETVTRLQKDWEGDEEVYSLLKRLSMLS